jgi:hypothetical protein
MNTNVDQGRLALARTNFEPVAWVLDRLARDIERDHGRSATLQQTSPMEQTAQNAFTVRYSLRHPDSLQFALTFVVTGDDADLLLMQAQQRSGRRDVVAHPGQVDQRVYSLEKINDIKSVIQEKISAHLRSREERVNQAA